MLIPWRRHTPKCKHRHKGRDCTKCNCPIWADGTLDGKRFRRSLKTRDWARATRKLAALESPDGPIEKPIAEALEAHLGRIEDELAVSTRKKYRRILEKHFLGLTSRLGLINLRQITAETIDAYRASRDITAITWLKELEILRQFFQFCMDREWIGKNPAKLVRAPKNIQPKPVEPYTQEEVVSIISACDFIGRGSYERLRARAMVLLLRCTALRISDVATLGRDRVRGGKILLHTLKGGKTVHLPVPPQLQMALDVLPVPRGTHGESRYFFWTGNGSKGAVIDGAQRTLKAVFRQSAVPGAHSHRFRHTLATEILEKGGTIEDAANVLGNSPMIIRRHYAQWSILRQERIESLLQGVFSGTLLAQTENRAATC